MNTISYRKIREFVALHPNAESSLSSWYKIARRATWQNIVEVREDYPHADLVGRFTVFNIGGNNYRVIAESHFDAQSVLIRHIMTHGEYDKEEWKI
jgi:mRNA interferase HigB